MPTRSIAAPALREVAEIWWDLDVVPEVRWDASGRRFTLADPAGTQVPLVLLELEDPAADPAHVAGVLAEGLAACDFPPTGDGAAPGRVRATLRAANLDVGAITR